MCFYSLAFAPPWRWPKSLAPTSRRKVGEEAAVERAVDCGGGGVVIAEHLLALQLAASARSRYATAASRRSRSPSQRSAADFSGRV